MMRVLFITQYFPPEGGAGARRARAFANYFAKKGCAVEVVCGMPNYPSRELMPGYDSRRTVREVDGALEVVRLRAPGFRRTDLVGRSIYEAILTIRVFGRLARRRADLVVITVPSPYLAWLAPVARLLRRNVILDVRDLTFEYVDNQSRILRMLTKALGAAFVWCAKRATIVLAATRGIAADLARAGVKSARLRLLMNGVDAVPTPGRPAGRSGAEVQALYAGLVGRRHGVEVLAEAAQYVRGLVNFRIVGDGPCLPELQGEVSRLGVDDMFTFDAPVGLDDVSGVVAGADYCVVTLRPSTQDAVPAKVFDAIAVGRPILYIGEGEGADLVRESGAGISVPWGDVSGIAEAIRHLADPVSRAGFAEGARALALQYDRAHLMEQVLREVIPCGSL